MDISYNFTPSSHIRNIKNIRSEKTMWKYNKLIHNIRVFYNTKREEHKKILHNCNDSKTSD